MEELEELIEDADRDGSGSVDFQVVFLGGIPGSFLGGFPGSLLGRFPGSFTNSSERMIFFIYTNEHKYGICLYLLENSRKRRIQFQPSVFCQNSTFSMEIF